jgi:fructuronate reductase
MDGSQKLPQRLLATVRENLAAGRPVERLALAVAAWMRYVAGVDERGGPIDVADPLRDRFATIAASHRGDPRALGDALLGIAAIFGDDLPHDARFAGAVRGWLEALFRDGAARTVDACNQRP